MQTYYPFFLNIRNRNALVVGAGLVAARKVRSLLEAGANVTVVSAEIGSELEAMSSVGNLTLIRDEYQSEHLSDVFLVFAATNDRDVNRQIVCDAQARRIPVASVDAPESADFIVPAVVRRGDLCIAVSSSGGSPTLSQRIKGELESRYGAEYALYSELLIKMRSYIKRQGVEKPQRRAAYDALAAAEPELLRRLLDNDTDSAAAEAQRVIDNALASPPE